MKAIKKPIPVDFEFATDDGEIETLGGKMTYKKGDAIITGVKGEKYPCRRDIFDQTYSVGGRNKVYAFIAWDDGDDEKVVFLCKTEELAEKLMNNYKKAEWEHTNIQEMEVYETVEGAEGWTI
jgi:hypothetical protein